MEMLRRSLLLRIRSNTRILVSSTTERCLRVARGLVIAAIPCGAHVYNTGLVGCEGAHVYNTGLVGCEGAHVYNTGLVGCEGAHVYNTGLVAVRERRSYIAGLVAATAVATETLKPADKRGTPWHIGV
jgi:hypothetical protein